MVDKQYDIVLYGATGFTGRLAAKYLNKTYGKSISWAIAGRSEAKLRALAAEIGCDCCGILVADSGDVASLKALCSAAACIVTCAGPFARYGTSLVEQCVDAGVDYCDITGETAWVRDMIADYDDRARKSGARIVHLCGHDSVPWDLTTLMLSKKLAELNKGEQLASVDFYDHIRSSPSGGTLETAMGIMFGKEKGRPKSAAQKSLGYDPLLKTPSGGASASQAVARNVALLQLPKKGAAAAPASAAARPVRTMFFMAGVNACSVKRSNALNQYGPKVGWWWVCGG
jgi:short subunit dehydrogenase-like uncharacterized protein